MFQSCGFEVLSTHAMGGGRRARLIAKLSGARLRHLFIGQMTVVARKTEGA
jgi:hypothetical protein